MTNDPLTLTLALLLGTIAVARATRLVTSDHWPPILWARMRWLTWTAQTEARTAWADLATCPFCFAPYAAAVDLGWATYWDLPIAWWLVNAWAALSYASAMLVVRDEPPAEG